MAENPEFDLLIVGSGPSGVQAAQVALQNGIKVGLIDIGFTEDKYEKLIPPMSFSEIKKSDPNQSFYFLGENEEAAFQSQAKAGAHLTPPRQHMIRDMEKIFPIESSTFLPLQSTAQGGLGVSWGSNVFGLEDFELNKIGIDPIEIKSFYKETAYEIGVSGDSNDDLAKLIAKDIPLQRPLLLDSMGQSILKIYQKKRAQFLKNDFILGQSVLANLSEPIQDRSANPHWDMDFWSDAKKSVYRPQFTLSRILKEPSFYHLPGRQAIFFKEADCVSLHCKNVRNNNSEVFKTKCLLLAAGAIGSGRIALRSFSEFKTKIPILCNPNLWVAALHWPLLGRPVQDARYSLAQLTSLLRVKEDPQDYVLAQFYSYRSLLLSRLLLNIPLPPSFGLLFTRLILNSFTCVNLHFSDHPSPLRWLQLKEGGETLLAHSEFSVQEKKTLRTREHQMLNKLFRLSCFPFGVSRPAHGASIHYAGTLPYSRELKPLTCDPSGKLHGTSRVYVGDGSTWNYLPAKGLTFTLMANARRIASHIAKELIKSN